MIVVLIFLETCKKVTDMRFMDEYRRQLSPFLFIWFRPFNTVLTPFITLFVSLTHLHS